MYSPRIRSSQYSRGKPYGSSIRQCRPVIGSSSRRKWVSSPHEMRGWESRTMRSSVVPERGDPMTKMGASGGVGRALGAGRASGSVTARQGYRRAPARGPGAADGPPAEVAPAVAAPPDVMPGTVGWCGTAIRRGGGPEPIGAHRPMTAPGGMALGGPAHP